MKEKSLAIFVSTILSVFFIVYIVFAWTEPSQAPPGGNVPAPINVGPQGQAKEGGLILNTGGAEYGLIVDKGKVGIGMTNPDRPLTIKGSGTNSEWISLKDRNGTTQWHINYKNGGLNFVETGVADGRLYLKDGGKVGIGTTSPTQKLDVIGGYIRSDTGFCIGSDCITSWKEAGGVGGSGTKNYLAKWTDSTTLGNSIIYDTGSKIGIGTNSPTRKLDVRGWLTVGGHWQSNGFVTFETQSNFHRISFYNLHFYEGGYGDIVTFNNGRVGIGTTNPDRPLTIKGSGTNSEWISLKDRNGTTQWHINYKNGGLNFVETGVADGRLYLKDGGKVGIGTTNPQTKLHIAGCPSGSACLKLTGGDAKIDAGIVDPVFNIDGKNYSTYMVEFAGGPRVETSGTAKLKNGKFIIDFEKAKEGSDLWLFWKVSSKKMEEIAVIVTPGFEGKVWYEKEGKKIIIFGEKDGEISFKLSAPRFDREKWGNLSENQEIEGIKIEK